MNDQVLEAEIIALEESPAPGVLPVDDYDSARALGYRRRRHRSMLWISGAVVALALMVTT